MSDVTPFVLPKGTSLAVGGNSLVVRHDGDIVMEQTLGRRLSRIEAGGDLTLRCSPITGVLHAVGTLTTEGDVDAQEIRAESVYIGPGDVRARAIIGTKRVVIGAAKLAVDVVVAPHVEIDDDARGRIRVVDCLNDRPATRVRGCLSLEDYEQDFGGVAEFLARRGVIPLHPLPGPSEESSTDEPAAPASAAPASTAPVEAATTAPVAAAAPPPGPPDAVLPAAVVEVRPGDGELTDEDLEDVFAMDATVMFDDDYAPADSVHEDALDDQEQGGAHDLASEEDLEVGLVDDPPVATPVPIAPVAVDDEDLDAHGSPIDVHLARHAPAVRRSVARIVRSYGDAPPPGVNDLARLSRAGKFNALRGSLDDLWLGVLRHHLGQATQPPRVVIQSFQAIHALLE
jgi:hypothetical protein